MREYLSICVATWHPTLVIFRFFINCELQKYSFCAGLGNGPPVCTLVPGHIGAREETTPCKAGNKIFKLSWRSPFITILRYLFRGFSVTGQINVLHSSLYQGKNKITNAEPDRSKNINNLCGPAVYFFLANGDLQQRE
jgi:hypothetical protein